MNIVPIAIRTRYEGESISSAILTLGDSRDSNGYGLYISLRLPIFTYGLYEDFMSAHYRRGWRVLIISARIRRNKQGKWFSSVSKWWKVISSEFLCTREEYEDGIISNELKEEIDSMEKIPVVAD